MPTFTRTNYYADIDRSASDATNIDRIANRAARFVVADVDLRSTKRRAYLSPLLNEDLFDYQAPADLKEQGVIDIRRLVDRMVYDKFDVVNSEYFDRNKTFKKNLVCIEDRDFIKKLRVSADLGSEDGSQVVVNEADSLTTNGAWSVSLDASALTLDQDIFIHGDASLRFKMDQAGTTTNSGILVNSTMDQVDMSGYEDGFVFVYVYIPATTALSGFTLRIGNSASVYFEDSVTTTNENTSFTTGWNLLRFDLSGATETGTVDLETIDYLRLTLDMNAVGRVAQVDWRADYFVARRGVSHELWYYTSYPWQNSSGTYLANSSAASDLLNADAEEYELFIVKGKEMLARDFKQFDNANLFRQEYEAMKEVYQRNYKSERLLLRQPYRNMGTDFRDTMLS